MVGSFSSFVGLSELGAAANSLIVVIELKFPWSEISKFILIISYWN